MRDSSSSLDTNTRRTTHSRLGGRGPSCRDDYLPIPARHAHEPFSTRGVRTGCLGSRGLDLASLGMLHSGFKEASLQGGIVRIGAVVVLVWLIIGAIAAGQRHYYSGSSQTCAHAGTVAVTVLAGPLNYVGVNPKISCHIPQPSS
jgi:hypothetical protein